MSVDLKEVTQMWLAERHARGYQLKDYGWLLASFLAELAERQQNTITAEAALAFASRTSASRTWQADRLRAVAGLAAYVHQIDPAAAELIPSGLIRARRSRPVPYLYSADQISALMAATDTLSPVVFAAGVRTLIGLLAVTGIRSGEAFALDLIDLNVDQSLLLVCGKQAKKRLVPLHTTTLEAIVEYQKLRPRPARSGKLPLLFGPRGGRLNRRRAREAFRALVTQCRIEARAGCRMSPRLHDFRHSFAVNTLLDAYRQTADVDARMSALSTFLGHAEPLDTYWYLTASPELLAVVAERLSTLTGKHER
jgi:integrase